jgi:inorganic pyrophosphatase
MSVSHFNEVSELPANFLSELKHFFLHYKNLENKTVLVDDFKDRKSALQIIEKALLNYNANFPKK